MKLIVGLGNPGEKYSGNRHNVGFVVVDKLVESLKIEGGSEAFDFKFHKKFNAEVMQTKDYILAKPQTFMNDSGEAISKIVSFYKIKPEDVYVIHDDLDIKLGSYKIIFAKAPKVHNGLKSIEEKLGTDQYFNVRVGVENREIRGNAGVPGMVYSLQDFRPDEREMIAGVTSEIVKNLLSILQGLTS